MRARYKAPSTNCQRTCEGLVRSRNRTQDRRGWESVGRGERGEEREERKEAASRAARGEDASEERE
eukprot:3536184-Rhodomonas_salina.1